MTTVKDVTFKHVVC